MVRSLVSAMRLPPGFTSYLHWNPPEPQQVSAPEPSGTSTRYLHRNPPEPHGLSAPEPSGTSTGICTGTLQNLTRYLHRNPPEPQQVSAPEPSGTLRNLARNLVLKLHRIAPELIWAKDPIAKFCCWGKTCFGLSRDHDAATLGRNASSLSRLENMCGKPKHSANLVEMSRTQSKHFTLNKTFRG